MELDKKREAFDGILSRSKSLLKHFTDSKSAFELVFSVTERQYDKATATEPTRQLLILDSSFDPPTLAHQALAIGALHAVADSAPDQGRRLLLLFSTANADKVPDPGSNAHRLAMIILFKQSLERRLRTALRKSVGVDIGLTTAARFIDKYAAITEADLFKPIPKHVHLMGYDTLVRFLAPRYYETFTPPLSALATYFEAGNSTQVLLRPDENEKSLQEQKHYLEALENGSLEAEGFKSQWAKQIGVLETDGAKGVSSTLARSLAEEQKWDNLAAVVGDDISSWIQMFRLYQERQ